MIAVPRQYIYNATVLQVYDGDTLTASLDLGMHVKVTTRLRLKGLNAPEITGETRAAGIRSRDFVANGLLTATSVKVQTFKDAQEKYGRYLADVWYSHALGSELNDPDAYTFLNARLIELGYAVPYL